jgi:hypothetical protein
MPRIDNFKILSISPFSISSMVYNYSCVNFMIPRGLSVADDTFYGVGAGVAPLVLAASLSDCELEDSDSDSENDSESD